MTTQGLHAGARVTKRLLVTGMSGTGKTTVMECLRARGFEATDTDQDGWCVWGALSGEAHPGWLWHEQAVQELLGRPRSGPLFVSGCVSNQGKFYAHFDHVVLLSAPLPVMLQRVRTRTTNPYGKTPAEQQEILEYTHSVEPLLRRGADLEFNTARLSAEEIADRLVALAYTSPL